MRYAEFTLSIDATVNGDLEMPNYGGIKVLNSISTYLHLSQISKPYLNEFEVLDPAFFVL